MHPVATTGSIPISDDRFTISDIVTATGTKVETVRYYERSSLMPKPPRTRANYRSYGVEHRRRLFFIRRSRELGFSIDQVRELLSLSDDRNRSCAAVDEISREHLRDVDRKIADLTSLRRELSTLISQRRHQKIAECRIIEALGSN